MIKKYLTFIKFSLTGVLNTFNYIALISILLNFSKLNLFFSNAISYTIATIISYYINSIWTFNRKVSTKNMSKFILVCLIGLIISSIISHIIDLNNLNNYIGVVLIVFTNTTLIFTLHKYWTFK